MKKLFSLLTLALLTMSAWAQTTVTFTAGTDLGKTTANNSADTISKDGVTIICTDAAFATAQYRFYANSTATITSTVGNITKVEFTCTGSGTDGNGPSFFTTTTGSYSYEGNVGTWTGNAASFTLAASKQVRATQIVVTIGGEVVETVAAPTLPASTTFEGSMTVEITNNDADATVMYSTNGTTWNEYTEALTITETTTVSAKAVKNGIESTVVSATYTRKPVVEYLEVTADMANNTEFIFSGNATVTAQEGAYLWLRDETGYGLIYGKINGVDTLKFTPGTILRPNWKAKTNIYNGLMEFVNATDVAASGNTNEEYTVPQTITELKEDMLNAYVQVLNVKSFTVSGKNVTATLSDGTTMVMYNQFSKVIPTSEGNYTVLGAVSTHNGLQLTIISIEGNYVSAPTLPASQNFEGSMTVEITNNEADAAVMYSTDGTTWNEYTEALTITETTTIYAKAVKGNLESDVVSATYTKVEPVTYTLVNNVNELANGDKIILVGFCQAEGDDYGKAYAMAEYRGDYYSNFNAVNVTVEDNTVTTGLANVITLEANGDYWNLKAAEGYLYAASSEKNQMRPEAEVDANANAAIYISTDSMSIVFQGENTRNYLRYNYNNGACLFSCYAQGSSVKTPAYIFKAKTEQPAGLRGDVNLDNAVNIADVTSLIDYLLSGDATGISLDNANCNLDEAVNIADVTALIDYLLSGSWPAE